MLSQYAEQFTGRKRVERAIGKLVGKDDMRPFDSGKLELETEGGQYVGQVVLTSAGLNLTVDLHIDASAVAEALKLAQSESLEDLSF